LLFTHRVYFILKALSANVYDNSYVKSLIIYYFIFTYAIIFLFFIMLLTTLVSIQRLQTRGNQ